MDIVLPALALAFLVLLLVVILPGKGGRAP
jgi:hypothetical protein